MGNIFGALTRRERDVARLLAIGRSNKLMARELNISVRTVEIHRQRIFQKLMVKNATELAVIVAHSGGEAPLTRPVEDYSGTARQISVGRMLGVALLKIETIHVQLISLADQLASEVKATRE